MFEESFRGLADLVLPGDELPRARRHDRQPRGPAAAPAPRRARAGAGRARLDREARGALRASSSRPHASVVFDEIVGALLRRHHLRRGRRAAQRCRRGPSRAGTPPPERPKVQARRPPARRLPPALLRRRSRAHARAAVPAAGRRGAALARGRDGARDPQRRRRSPSRRTARRVELRARIARDLARRHRAHRRSEHASDLHADRRGEARDARALVDHDPEGVRRDQRRDGVLRVHDVARAQAARPHADCATARTGPARRGCWCRSPTC